jgi:hypothetical protein
MYMRRTPSVSPMGPGEMVFTRILSGPHSTASVRDSDNIPALAAAQRGAGPAGDAQHGDDADDGAAVRRLFEVRIGRVAAVKRAVEINVDHGFPATRRQLGGGADKIACGIVDQYVESTEALNRALNCRLQLVVISHVSSPRCSFTALGCDGFDRGFDAVLVAANQHYRRADASVVGRDFQTDAAATAGDQRSAALERVVCKHQRISV